MPSPITDPALASFMPAVRHCVLMLEQFPKDTTAFLIFAASHEPKADEPSDRCSCFASGNQQQLVNTILNGLERNADISNVVTNAWVHHFIESNADTTDRDRQALRRALIRLSGLKPSEGQPSLADNTTPADEAAAIIADIAAEHPDRQNRVAILKARAKQYRRSGLTDIALALTAEVNRLLDEVAADEQAALDADQQRAARVVSAAEARRVRQQLADEHQEQLRWEHDFASLQRRQRAIRAHIAQAQQALDALIAEQQQMEQRPQFNVHKAAQQKRAAIAARKAERKARKKRASQQ